ncbi:MAG: LPXTG cell wall anchor domain-containing protein [Atopobium sp.]|nr:LPXTG cell wall anchor domain-containing protein [Atopobium sp.]
MNGTSVRSVRSAWFSRFTVLAICMLFVGAILAFAFPRTAFAADPTVYSEDVDGAPLDGTHTSANPFPDFISDAEIQAEINAQAAKPREDRTGVIARYYWVKPDGTALKLDMDPTKYSVAQMIAEGGEIRAYYVLLGDTENLINFPHNDPNGYGLRKVAVSAHAAVDTYKPMDATGALSGGGPKNNLMFTVKVNGQSIMGGTSYEEPAAVFTAPVTARQYIEFSAPLNISDRSYQLGIQGGIKKSWGGTHAYTKRYPARVIDTATAVYHYVDDLAYRQLNGLGLSDPIAQRNAGLPIYGNGAVSVLGLDDLAATYTTSAAFEDRQVSARYNTKGHVVYMPEYAGVTADDSVAGGNKFETDPSTNLLLTTVRKSVDEIKSAGPGDSYVYIANDIDVPEGTSLAIGTYNSGPRDNSVLAPGFNADGSVNRTRQYYLTYRAVPSPLKLVKTDSDDASKPVAGATYSLYKADGTLVKEGLTTGADGTFTSGDVLTKTELTTLVQNAAATADLLTKGIYQDGDKFYLTPGDYYLVETASPEGYELNANQIPFTVAPATYNAADQTIVPTEVATADKPITPTPTPTPDPNPEPKPKTPKKKRSNLPDTGDAMSIASALAAAGIIASGLAYSVKARR